MSTLFGFGSTAVAPAGPGDLSEPEGPDPSLVDESMVGSLTDQLVSLYSERESLQSAIGCSSAEEVLALVASLKNSIRVLVDEQRRRLDYEASLLTSHERFLA